jgi:KDO2-lipid IV(A) lauroyltransferase
MWTLRKALARGETVGILCDSSSRKAEAFPPFLGTPAATVATPALLHLTTGAPVVVATAQRTGRGRFSIRVWDVIRCAPTADRDADVDAILARINLGLSRAVAAAPEQWFWQGGRFKHRPPGEVPGPDGLPPVAASPRDRGGPGAWS